MQKCVQSGITEAVKFYASGRVSLRLDFHRLQKRKEGCDRRTLRLYVKARRRERLRPMGTRFYTLVIFVGLSSFSKWRKYFDRSSLCLCAKAFRRNVPHKKARLRRAGPIGNELLMACIRAVFFNRRETTRVDCETPCKARRHITESSRSDTLHSYLTSHISYLISFFRNDIPD
jgi:hypothetical protein